MKNKFRGLGASRVNGRVYSFVADKNNPADTFIVQSSSDGRVFVPHSSQARISSVNLPIDTLETCSHFHVSSHDDYYYLTYQASKASQKSLLLAQSTDLINWEKMTVVSEEKTNAKVIPEYTFKDHLMMYAGGKTISLLASDNLMHWYEEAPDVIGSAKEGKEYIIADIKILDEGIFLIYYEALHVGAESAQAYKLKAALFQRDNPRKVLWKSKRNLHKVHDDGEKLLHPFAMVTLDDAFVAYWQSADDTLQLFYHQFKGSRLDIAHKAKEKKWKKEELPQLERSDANPIMAPKKEHVWESKAAFNPAAIFVNGVFHILYRAIGDGDVSVLGYAQSEDGINITKRLDHPAYVPREIFEGALKPQNKVDHKNWSPFMSGGGAWGGCEDPRLNRMGDRIYLTYVAYNGWQPPRLAMSWITITDFLAHNWNWSKPVLISPPGVVSKSGSMLPEKIDNHYVFFHRVFPDIHIDFIDDLDRFDGKSFFLKCKESIKVREDQWDAGKFSMGAPPMKTKDGWLVIYSAVSGRQEWKGSDLRYKIGAMLLDLKDPTKVIYRSNDAVLVPETHYENEGAKPGIIYPCGAAIKENTLFVYYGGADEFTCVATADLPTFLEKLKVTGKIESE